MRKVLFPLAVLAFSVPALADAPATPTAGALPLQQQAETMLATAPQGTRFGLLVVDEQGRVIVSVNPDQRFIPASNTKMFTTAAAYALLSGMDQPDRDSGTEVVLASGKGVPDAVLRGRGDARLSSAPDCTVNCLAELADAVAARTRKVHDVIGDDSFWPDQRWVPGMSWNNIGTDSGTAVSALNLDDNELSLVVRPAAVGQPPVVDIGGYYAIENLAVTAAPGSPTALFVERPVNGNRLRVYGTIAAGGKEWTRRIGIDDPAHRAAWVFRRMLEARGVKVTGAVRVIHRPPDLRDQPRPQPGVAPPVAIPGLSPLAALAPPPLAEDVVTINKDSQNLHAQVLFRRIGDRDGSGSEQWAAQALNGLFEKAGVPRSGYDFSDGSGMSTYNRVSPRAVVALLRWIDTQPWSAAWHASLPVAGRDGTLKRRFIGTPLEGNLAAKTGTLNATNALSGTFRAASGRRLLFAFYANDVPDGAAVTPLMEAVLVRIAARN